MSVHVPVEIQRRVDAGAEWLDKRKPGWVDTIDLADLDLASPCDCVLGQLVSQVEPGTDFFDVVATPWIAVEDVRAGAPRGFKKMVMTRRRAIDLGFHSEPHEGEWESLTTAWRRLIKRRRTSPKASA